MTGTVTLPREVVENVLASHFWHPESKTGKALRAALAAPVAEQGGEAVVITGHPKHELVVFYATREQVTIFCPVCKFWEHLGPEAASQIRSVAGTYRHARCQRSPSAE